MRIFNLDRKPFIFLVAIFLATASSLAMNRAEASEADSVPSGDASALNLKNESELGIVQASGNSDVKTFNLQHKSDLKADHNSFGLNGRYLKSTNSGVEAANLWRISGRYEREAFGKFSGVLGQYVEADKFTNIRQRYGTDLGAKYYILKNDTGYGFAELGGRHTRENFRAGGRNKYNSMRVYAETEHKWTPTFSSKLWAEYLPNFTQSTDWQFNSELSVAAAISSMFSIKTGYLIRYDNLPAGAFTKMDRLFTTALVAKF